ncbi:hypothetical protein HOM50_05260 [bacterium]|nr:hypothetical protein [bacterium]MBT5015790.1 hypothetical protein [bacterium]
MKRYIQIIVSMVAVVICANFSSQDSDDLKKICSGQITYYSDSKKDEIVDIKIGASKGSSSNGSIKFYMAPKKKSIKQDDLIYDQLNLTQIKSIAVLGTPEKEITRIDKKDYINVEVVVYLSGTDKGTKTVKYMLPEDTKIYGRKKATGSQGRYPISSVSKLELVGCVEEGANVDLAKLCGRYEESKSATPAA